MMRRLISILVLLAIRLPLSADVVPPATLPPHEPHWELFLDDHIITRSTGFQRVLHHPQPRGIVIPADKPWETQGSRQCTSGGERTAC